MPIKEFQVGKYYKWTGSQKRPDTWNPAGSMDIVLDGKPHKCIKISKDPWNKNTNALFENMIPNIFLDFSEDDTWAFSASIQYFEEVRE